MQRSKCQTSFSGGHQDNPPTATEIIKHCVLKCDTVGDGVRNKERRVKE